MMLLMVIAIVGMLCVVGGIGWVVLALGRRRLPGHAGQAQERLAADQADRIALLEDELQRVKDQADFTERLLAEREEARPPRPSDE